MSNPETGPYVLAAIEEIAADSSKNNKEALIKKHGGASELFMRTIKAAYDPFVNYGISYVEPINTHESLCDLSWGAIWGLLRDLAERTISGDYAKAQVDRHLQALDPASGEVLRRIIQKDLRAGFSEGTINKVFKGTFKEHPYMRCTLPEKSNMANWDWSRGIYSQVKADGMFANLNLDEQGNVWITSRQGQLFPDNVLTELKDEAGGCLGFGTQTHGELLVYRGDELLERQVGNGLLNSLQQGGELPAGHVVQFVAWDQVPLHIVFGGGTCDIPYQLRLNRLVVQLRDGVLLAPIETKVVYTKAAAFAHYRELTSQGFEGTVVKHPEMLWRDTGSGGNKDQVKLKIQADFEVRIKGFNPGSPGTKTAATFGSIQCESECGRVKFGVSGISDKLRLEMHNNRDHYIDKILTARGNGLIRPADEDAPYAVFLPRVVEVREDKVSADTLEQIEAIFKAAAEAA